jgi:hypothetical protein
MQHRKLKTTLAILAAAAGVSAFTASANAAVVKDDLVGLYFDPVVNLPGAHLEYDFSNGTITPRLTATLTADNAANACVRAHLYSYDGDTLLHDKPGAMHCPKNDAHKEWPVDLSEDADARTDNVIIAVEKKSASRDWTIKNQTDSNLQTFADIVSAQGNGISASGDDYDPVTDTFGSSFAIVSWSIDDGEATANFEGDLNFDDFSRWGRVELRALDHAGNVIDTVDGDPQLPPDNGQYHYEQNLTTAPLADLEKVEVVVQSSLDMASWQDVVTDTVSIAAHE